MDKKSLAVLRDNLLWLKYDTELSADLYRSALSDLAHLAVADGSIPPPADAKALFSEICPMDIRLFAQFCDIITNDRKHCSDSREPRNVSYVRSPMTDKAFTAFSAKNSAMGAVYGADFKSICEDVYYERADACILPLESSDDGLLMSFMKLIMKYELWIHGIYRFRNDDESFVTLALLTAVPDSIGDLFELYLPSSAKAVPEDICIAVRTLDGKVLRISTVSDDNGPGDIHACVYVHTGKAFALRYLLDALYPSHMILGNYSNSN